ncbi:Sir2 family NAD-dependent protein deacetylase [Nocardia sp. NPDC051832]|uniref:SIR2 family NAD-dependent protein deacylase n=1 Tax=Nocardia sp. NPDC051832 TaxID=3155673 RepID=UPI00343AC002
MNDMSWARGVTRLAVLTGAGISTDSGLPDYRGPQGTWTKDPALIGAFTEQNFLASAEVRDRFWHAFSALHRTDIEPNAAHSALAELDRGGLAVRVLTQNVDGLHQRAGSPERKVLELHGSLATVDCRGCGARSATESVLTRVAAGAGDPRCGCGGILKPSIVMFGQYLDGAVLAKARTIAAASQLFLAIGSSLQVEPAASLCALAVQAGAKLVIVNRDPTPYDALATAVIREPIGTAVPAICRALAAR